MSKKEILAKLSRLRTIVNTFVNVTEPLNSGLLLIGEIEVLLEKHESKDKGFCPFMSKLPNEISPCGEGCALYIKATDEKQPWSGCPFKAISLDLMDIVR